MVDKTSQMFVTGPDVIKTVTGEDVGMEELGGAYTHNTRSGVAHYLAEDEDDAIDYVRTMVGFLPDNNMAEIPVYENGFEWETTDADRTLNTVIPDSPNQPYDIHQVISHVVDGGDFLEVQPLFAPNIVIGFGRVEGRTVGIIANQPSQMAGTLNIEAGEKASRFVRFCDAFSIPILTLVDVPGYLPGTDQEWTGVIRRGAKLLYAYAEATVPLVTVILRKAYGGAYIVMGSKQLGADVNLAWPTAEIAVMGGQGAVNILYRGEIKQGRGGRRGRRRRQQRLANEYTYNVASLPRRRARRARRHHRARADPRRRREGAAVAAREARQPAPEEAREHPAMSTPAPDADMPVRMPCTSTSVAETPPRRSSPPSSSSPRPTSARRTPSSRTRRCGRPGRSRRAACVRPAARRGLGTVRGLNPRSLVPQNTYRHSFSTGKNRYRWNASAFGRPAS
jgi:acetyl-CoA carboxylase carboxyltransferase component